MLKPGVGYPYLIPNNVYSKNKIENQVSHYCKSEGIEVSHYVYLMENNKNQKYIKSKLSKLPLGIFGMISITLVVLYNLF